MDKVLYRNNNAFGDNVRKPLDVMVYEIFELGNTDIIEYCTEHYSLSNDLRNDIDDIIDNIDDIDEEDVISVIKMLLSELNELYGRPIKEVIWLASLDAVNDLYDGTDDNADIEAYCVEDAIILSNLGYDGLLFGFFERPKILNEKLSRMIFKNMVFRCVKNGKMIYKKTNFSYDPKFHQNRLCENFNINQVVPMLERYGLIENSNYLINQTKKSADFDVDVLNNDIYINNLNGNNLLSIAQFIYFSDNDKHNIENIHMFLLESVYFMDYSEMQARLEKFKSEIETNENLTQQYYIYLRYKEQFKWLIDNLSESEIKQYNEKYISIFNEIYPQFSKSKKQISIIDILKQYIKRIDNLFLKQANKIKSGLN